MWSARRSNSNQYLKYLTTRPCLDLQHSHACCNVTNEATSKFMQHVSQVAGLLRSSQVSTSIQYPSPASRCWAHFGPAAPRCTRNLVVWPGNVRPSWTVFSMSFPWPMVQINQCYSLVLQHLEERDFIWSNWLQYIMHLHQYVTM